MNLEHPDFHLLFERLTKISKEFLKMRGGFLPHGAIVSPEGKVSLVGTQTQEAQPGAEKVLQLLEGALRGMAAQGKCRATGMALDTRLKAAPRPEWIGKDAIWVLLEEKGGKAQSVFVPYWKSWMSGFTYGEAFPGAPKPSIFGSSR